MTLITAIALILQGIAGLLQSPGLTASQLQNIQTTVADVQTLVGSVSGTSTPVIVPAQTTSTVLSVPLISGVQNAPTSSSPSSTQKVNQTTQYIPFKSVIDRFMANAGNNVAYFNVYPRKGYTPFNITISVNGETLNDPAFPDGLGMNLTAKNLTPSTTYNYNITIQGNGWDTSSTGTFTTNP